MKTFRQLALVVVGSALAMHAAGQTGSRSVFQLTGKVVDPEGKPIAGATVERFQFGTADPITPQELEVRQKTTTDTNGRFELRTSRTYILLLARKPGFALAWKHITPEPEREYRLVLQPWTAAIEGVVVDTAGQPVTNAEVWAVRVAVPADEDEPGPGMNTLWSRPARYCFSANTTADGHFRLAGFPTNATAFLAARAPGKVSSLPPYGVFSGAPMPHRAGQNDVRLVVEPAGDVEGKLVVGDTNVALPTARLVLQADLPGCEWFTGRQPVRSGPDGVFVFKDVAPGTYTLRAMFESSAFSEWTIESVEVTVEPGQTTRDVRVPVVKGGALEVIVLDKKTRNPVPEVNINVHKDTFRFLVFSDSSGLAMLRLPPGDYQLFAYKENWRAEELTASVEAGKTNHVEIELSPPPKVTGIVRNPDGTPAPRLKVILVGTFGLLGEREVKTDNKGRFEIEFQVRQFGLQDITPCLLVRDPERNLAAAQEIDEETSTVELQLAPGLTIAGRVECAGKPVSNVNARLVFWTGGSGAYLDGLATGTNVPGRFEIPALPPGRKYGVVVSAPGYGQRDYGNIAITDEAGRIELEPIELKLANLKLAGQVLDADDKPVAGAYVRLYGPDQPDASTRTDSGGRFSFDNVCEGPAQLFASTQRTHGSVSAEGGDTNVVLRLGEIATYSPDAQPKKLKGTVTGLDGKPAVGAQVAVFPSRTSRWAKADTNGAFSLTWSIESWMRGTPCVVARDPVHNLAVAEEIDEDDTHVSLKLKPALTVLGRVQDPHGKPLTNANVSLNLMVGNYGSLLDDKPVQLDPEGGFEFRPLPPDGRYMIWASANGYGSARAEVERSEDGTNRIELPPLVLKRADRKLAGQVVDAEGKPVAGANVRIQGDGQPSESVTTDKAGRFSVNVCEGNVEIFVRWRNAYDLIRVEGGDTNLVIALGAESSSRPVSPRRRALTGKSLPALATVNIASDAVPAGRPVLLCLFDPDQRPSRRCIRLLAEQYEALQAKGITVLGIYAVPTTPDAFAAWKNANPMPFPAGYVTEKSDSTKWVTDVQSLPWLILADATGSVIADGFALDELDTKLKQLEK